MSRRPAATALLATIALASTVLAGPVLAAPTWLTPATPISDPTLTSFDPDVAVDARGDVTVVWTAFVPDPSGGHYIVESAYRPAGGAWTPSVQVSSPTDETTDSQNPDLDVDDAGNATAVWVVGESTGPMTAKVSSRPPGGAWSDPVPLASGDYVFGPQVTVDPSGNATAVWTRFSSGNGFTEARTRPAGSVWGPVDTLDTYGGTSRAVAAAPDGTVVATWQRLDGSSLVIRARVRTPEGVWGAPLTVSPPGLGDPEFPVIAAGGNGGFVVAWQRRTGPTLYFVQAATRSADGTWSSSTDISVPSDGEPGTAVVMDPAGTATIVWKRYDGTNYYVRASQQAVGGNWSPPVDVAGPLGALGELNVTADGAGRVTAGWVTRPDGVRQRLQAASRPAGGSWTPPQTLSDPNGDAFYLSLAADPLGNAIATYALTATGSVGAVQALALDGAGPTLDGFSAPASVAIGAPVTYAATATDTWSAVTGYSWSFGDETTATGPIVSHAYAAPGSYPVTLTVTDAVGNTTTRAATTTVPVPVPVIGTFTLTRTKIQALSRAVAKKTKLKIGLNTAATFKLVIKSKHRHLVKGKKKYVRVVLRKQLPAGFSTITLKARLKHRLLPPDTYVITGIAKNSAGTSPKKKTKLKVVR